MALLPTLSAQIFEQMNVEAISRELQAQSRRTLPGGGGAEAPASAAPPADAGGAAAADAPQGAAAPAAGEPANGQKDTSGADGMPTGTGQPAKMSLEKVSEEQPAPISDDAKLPPAAQLGEQPANGDVPKPVAPAPPSAPAAPTGEPPAAPFAEMLARFEEERRATKLQLWNQIKLTSFSCVLTTLYALVLLSLQTYIQLNLIGRRSYISALQAQARDESRERQASTEPHHITLQGEKESMVSGAVTPDMAEDEQGRLVQETEKQYLTSSWWFLHRGWATLAERVQSAVRTELDEVPLKTIFTLPHFQELVQRLRERIEGSDTPLGSVLLPQDEAQEVEMLRAAGALAEGEGISMRLRYLLDETKDYIDSPDFARVFDTCIQRVLTLLLQRMAPAFGRPGTTEQPANLLHGGVGAVDRPQLLAKLLPLVAQQAQAACTNTPNDYVETITECKELRALSVLVYTAWDEELAA